MNIEDQILREVEASFGGAYPQMMAECMQRSPTFKKLLHKDHCFYLQECIAIKDAPMITNGIQSKLAELIGCNRGSLGKYIKSDPDKHVMVTRNHHGDIVDLEI